MVSGWQLESIRFFSDFAERFGERLDVHDIGYLLLARADERDQLEAAIAAGIQAGCQVQEIDAAQARDLQPGINCDDDTVCAFEPGAVYLDPMLATRALARAAMRAGVQL